MNAIGIAAALCRRFEGCHLTPYLCPAGIPTIGYGATYYENGRKVSLYDPEINKEYAEALLLWHLENVYLPAVLRLCPNIDDPEKMAAIIDFTFNLGGNNLKNSTLRVKILEDDWEGAVVQLKRWIRGGGKVLRGLVYRRQAEADLIERSND
jgi:lysozyme